MSLIYLPQRFWAGPISVFVCLRLVDLWVREKIVSGITTGIASLGYLILMVRQVTSLHPRCTMFPHLQTSLSLIVHRMIIALIQLTHFYYTCYRTFDLYIVYILLYIIYCSFLFACSQVHCYAYYGDRLKFPNRQMGKI